MANFASMLGRLVEMLRYSIHNGELTERGLARACGISQPHIHHVVSGRRRLSPESADRILDTLGWSAADLLISSDISSGANYGGPGSSSRIYNEFGRQ